jgi:hypothetical protein
MKVLFAFAALLAFAASQCSLEGNTYTEGDRSLTFGAAVGEWVPGLTSLESGLSFSTWTQQTATRWSVKDFGSLADWFCDSEGLYNIEFFNACTEIHFTVLHDVCGERMALLQNVFTLAPPTSDDCTAAGHSTTAHLSVSKEFPRLSGDRVHVVFGLNSYALVSVADRAVIVQRWRTSSSSDEDMLQVVDLGSYPEGYACDAVDVGSYTWINLGDSCAARVCISEDACRMRAQLWHNVGLNDFEGDMCNRDIEEEEMEPHCSGGKEWRRHPKDCVAQEVPGGCMFCKGIAMGVTTMWCLDRQGAVCEEVFESTARQAYCNLEFECSATASLGASFVIFICSLLALFLR